MKRVLIVAVIGLVLASVAAFSLRPARLVPESAPTEAEMAHAVGAPIMQHIYRGHVPGRSGEIMLVPRPHRYIIGDWDLTSLGTDHPEMYTSHPNPWDYLSRVPIVFYGPGFIPGGRQIRDPVDIADIAPTHARFLGMKGFEADGEALDDLPPPESGKRPKVIFTVVIDGGGWNALQAHPTSHPEFDRLARRGTVYTNATVGSAPSITGALHATFGAGIYPLRSGIPGNQMRGPNGGDTPDDPRIDTWLQNADPRFLRVPTLADLWDESRGNKPVVASVSYEGWHLGMIGHGAQRAGGDRDIAVLWENTENEWWINEDYYRLPAYLETTDVERLEAYEERLDMRDGLEDGLWFGKTLEELRTPPKRPATPAFTRFTGDAVIQVMKRESIGKDDITDLVWIEMKPPDFGGHIWNVERAEQADVLLETDRQLARYRRLLDRTVGRNDYILTISADHGQQPLPDERGGWRINSIELTSDLEQRFGEGVIEVVSPVDVYVDRERLEEEGAELGDIARFIGSYTIGDNIPEGAPGAERVPEARLGERLFAGAFSTDYLQSLTAEDIDSFGDSDYDEGNFPMTQRGPLRQEQ